MKLHRNAALSWRVAARWPTLDVEGWTLRAAAEAAGVSVRCARKWVSRYRLAGVRGLCDRSSAPCCVANPPQASREEAIPRTLRRPRFTGDWGSGPIASPW